MSDSPGSITLLLNTVTDEWVRCIYHLVGCNEFCLSSGPHFTTPSHHVKGWGDAKETHYTATQSFYTDNQLINGIPSMSQQSPTTRVVNIFELS